MEMASSVWSPCFLLLALLSVINVHDWTPHGFFHFCSGCLLSKAEKCQQMLCSLSSFSICMQIPFNNLGSRKSLTVSFKPYFFEGNRTLIQWWPTAKAGLCWLKWFSMKSSAVKRSTEIQTFISPGHHAKVLLFSRKWALKFFSGTMENVFSPPVDIFERVKHFSLVVLKWVRKFKYINKWRQIAKRAFFISQ